MDTTSGHRPFVSIIFPAPVSQMALNMEVLYGVEQACRTSGYGLSVTSLGLNDDSCQSALDKGKDLIGEVLKSGLLEQLYYPIQAKAVPRCIVAC